MEHTCRAGLTTASVSRSMRSIKKALAPYGSVMPTARTTHVGPRTSLSWEFGETTEVATENCLSRSQTSVSMEGPPQATDKDQLFRSLRDLGADCVRLTAWRPYPRLAVAELEPALDGKTSWESFFTRSGSS
jgi:hypothetical protein